MCKSKRNGKSNRTFLSVILIIIILISLFSGCITTENNLNPPEMSYYFNYDDNGRLISYVDAEGNNIRYAYDEKGQIIETIYPDRQVQYKYDALGNLVTIKDGEGLVEFQYDAYDRLTKAKYEHSPERSVEFEYDPWDRIERMRVLDSNEQVVNSIGYKYDLFSRLKSIETSKGRIVYSYYPLENKMIRQYLNGIKSTFIFSSQMLPAFVKHEDKIGNLLAEYKYDYDASGHVIRALENFPDIGILETKYDWDNRGYLIGWTKPDGTKISYEYDKMGNRILKTDSSGTLQYKYDNFARLSHAGDLKYEWDRTGKLTSQIEGERITKIEYNGLDLPSVIKTPDTTVRYDWDAAGNMISKQQGDKITYILPNPLSPPCSALAEFDEAGKLTTSYIYGKGLLAQQDARGDMKYFLEDGFNSIRHVTNMNGKILGQRDYTPFGEHYAVKGDNVGNFYSLGVRFLPENKKYFVGNRLYDSSSGQYLSPGTEPSYSDRFDSYNEHTYLTQLRHLTQLRLTSDEQIAGWAGEEVIKAYWRNAFRQNYANYGRSWGPLFEWGYGETGRRMGRAFGDVFFATFSTGMFVNDILAAEEERRLQGVPAYSPEFWEDWGRRGLILMGSALGGSISGPLSHVGGLVGGHIGILAGEGAASFGRFLGVRMDRPFREWWIPYDEYLRRLEEQGRPQASVTPKEDRGKYYIDNERKYFYPLCPPFCDDGNGGGGGAAGANPLPQTPFSNEKELGGIELSAKARFIGDLGRITAAVYDNETGSLVLVGDGNISLPSLSQEDLRVALKLALTGEDAQFSLDPADPQNPRGEWLKAVYIPENILKGTNFGNELFEADWLLKQYSFGVKVDDSGGTSKRITNVDGFKDMFDLGFDSFDAGKKETWNRFWIVNDKATLRKTDSAIYFDTINMEVKTEEMHFTGKELKGNDKEDPDALKFAEFFSSHYDEFAEESPSFARVKEMAKAVALANWLVEMGIPIDMTWFSNATVEDKKFEDHMLALSRRSNFKISENEKGNKFVDQVHSLSENQEKRTQTEIKTIKGFILGLFGTNERTIQTEIKTINLFGGVDLKVKPDYVADDGPAKRIKEEVKEAICENPGQTVLDFQDSKQKLKAYMLPITKSGVSRWKDSTGGISDSAIIRNDNGKIQSFKLETIDGWKANAERTKNGGSEFTITTPNEHKFQYRYDSEGYLNQLIVDNNKVAEYQYNSQTRTLSIDYDGWKEDVTYDESGRVQSYTRMPDQGGKQQSEDILFIYDREGRLKGIDYDDLGNMKFEYKGDLLALAITPWGEFNYTYDSGNRLTAISESGNTVNFQYDGNSLNKVVVDVKGQTSEAIFINGLLDEIHGFANEKMKYEYNDDRLLTSVSDPQGAKSVFIYDDKLRLQRIELPNGSSMEYVYGIVGNSGNTKERLIKTIIYPMRSE